MLKMVLSSVLFLGILTLSCSSSTTQQTSPLGGSCTTTANCTQGICFLGKCHLATGQACTSATAADCLTNTCTNNLCAASNANGPCATSTDCTGSRACGADNKCVLSTAAGKCLTLADCATPLDCLAGTCATSRIIFTTKAIYSPGTLSTQLGTGAANADSFCQAEAYLAGSKIPPGKTFVALISTTSQSAYSRISGKLLDTALPVRNTQISPAIVFNQTDYINNPTQNGILSAATPWYDQFGNKSNDPWTGSTSPDKIGTPDSTCSNWSISNSGSAIVGYGQTSQYTLPVTWWNFDMQLCVTFIASLLCIEVDQ